MSLLSQLINLPPLPLISIVGAGGKTTTMYTLASELAAQGKRVITTTTTNIYLPKQGETDTLIVSPQTSTLLKMVNAAWQQHRRVTVAGGVIGAGKLAGLHPDQPYQLLAKSGADALIVEADGARHSMIKAPAEHEPVVPPQTNVALLMMSAEAINQPLSAVIAHRPERVAAVLGIRQGDLLTPARIAALMTSEQGAMKNIPEQAVIYLLITHVSLGKRDVVQQVVSLVKRSPRLSGICCSVELGEWFVL
ncbi:MAG TPA: selenium cofactor biosynthesis protein YqeC, partial [Ktedonobacteraceae bacterium]|nr:selenium cofactor biosynthesis protein YqeC [Ktedonobacteraceae bacterium]